MHSMQGQHCFHFASARLPITFFVLEPFQDSEYWLFLCLCPWQWVRCKTDRIGCPTNLTAASALLFTEELESDIMVTLFYVTSYFIHEPNISQNSWSQQLSFTTPGQELASHGWRKEAGCLQSWPGSWEHQNNSQRLLCFCCVKFRTTGCRLLV